MHYKGLSVERTCFLYLQDRIPGTLVALADVWISASCYKVIMVLVKKKRVRSCIVRPSRPHALLQVLANHLQIVTWCLIVKSVCGYSVSSHIVLLSTVCAFRQWRLSEHIIALQPESCWELASKTSLSIRRHFTVGKGAGVNKINDGWIPSSRFSFSVLVLCMSAHGDTSIHCIITNICFSCCG